MDRGADQRKPMVRVPSSLNVKQTVEFVEIEACAFAWRVKIGACIGEPEKMVVPVYEIHKP